MELSVLVNDTNYSDAALLEGTAITKEISGRVSTAEVTFLIDGDQARYEDALYDEARYGVDVRETYEIQLRNAATSALLFAGWITKVDYERIDDRMIQLHCSCHDWSLVLDQTAIVSEVFEAQSDRYIIQYLIAQYAPRLTALTANIAELIPSIGRWEIKDTSLRQALQDIADYTGAEFFVDFEAALRYFEGSTEDAPFGLSTDPDGSTTVEYRADEFTRDAERIINRATVLGGFVNGGAEINVTYDDPVSIAQYGVRASTLVDREISLTADALLRAQATVEASAYPLESGTAVLWQDGLDIGQLIPIVHDQFHIDGEYLIRSLAMKWITADEVEYTVGFGDPPPRLDRVLRQIAARASRSTQVAEAVPAPGSVTDDSIGGAGLSTAHLYGDINVSGNVTVSTAVLYGDITGANVTVDAAIIQGTVGGANVIIDAGRVQGTITGVDVHVDVQTFEGLIVSDQLAGGIIDSLEKYTADLRPIPRLASDPALPDPNYPNGSFYLRTSDGQFRKNNAGTWANATESEAVTGKLEFHHIGSMKVDKLIGLIAAGQIDTLNVTQLVGNLDVTRIDNLGTFSIGNFSGNLNVARIDGLNTLDINTFSGTINSLNATTVTLVGTWDDSHIGNIAASKLTAGTVTALVEFTSPLITGGEVNLAQTVLGVTTRVVVKAGDNEFIKCYNDATPTTRAVMGVSGFNLYNSGNNTMQMGQASFGGLIHVKDASGGSKFQLPGTDPFVSASAGAVAGYINVIINGTLRKMEFRAV
jgi:hypothetical protein